MIYLATPYSHPYSDVREARFHAVNKVAAKLMEAGHLVYSPISHFHPIKEAGGLPGGWDYFERHDKYMIDCCKTVMVLVNDGVRVSVGVKAEVQYARQIGLVVVFINDKLARQTEVLFAD